MMQVLYSNQKAQEDQLRHLLVNALQKYERKHTGA